MHEIITRTALLRRFLLGRVLPTSAWWFWTLFADMALFATSKANYVRLKLAPRFPCIVSSGSIFKRRSHSELFLPRRLSLLKGTWGPSTFSFSLSEKFPVGFLLSARPRSL